MGRDWKDRTIGSAALVLDVAKGAAEAFGPLKAVLETVSAVYNQYKVLSLRYHPRRPSDMDLQETAAVRDKIEVLRSRIATLEKIFEKTAVDVPEERRRKGLLTYVIKHRPLRTLSIFQ